MIKSIYIIAGEASGDFLGAQMITALKAKQPDITIHGVGGALMEGEGLNSLFDMRELSVMGIAEVLPKLFSLIKRINQTADEIARIKPDVVLTIDAPDFSFRVQKRVQKIMSGSDAPKAVHYVAPTVWAWRAGRAKKIAQFLDVQICLFDFEPPYFEREGLAAIAVGHPMMESGLSEAAPLKLGADNTQKLGVFFGSRQGEIKRIAPHILSALKDIIALKPDVELIVPTLQHLENQISGLLKDIYVPKHIVTDKRDKWAAFKVCDAAIAVSGTVGLELAACDVPHLIAYRTGNMTYQILKRVVKTPFAHLANIILRREVVPEFLQNECTQENIAKNTLKLLDNEQVRAAQRNAFADVRGRIKGDNSPSEIAADYILNL